MHAIDLVLRESTPPGSAEEWLASWSTENRASELQHAGQPCAVSLWLLNCTVSTFKGHVTQRAGAEVPRSAGLQA